HAARLTDPELVRALEWVRIARDLADGNAASGSARLEAILGARPTDVTARTAWVRIQERLHPEKAARALLAGARSLENEDATSTTSRLWAARAAWNLARAGKSAEAAQALERSGLPGLTPFGEAEPLLLELLGSAGRQRRKACDERAASAGSAASALLLALDALPDRQAASRVLAARQLDASSVEQDDPASWLALLLDVSNGHDDVTWPDGLGHDERAALTVEAARVRNDDEAALTAAEAWLGSTGHAATGHAATDDPAAGTDAAWLLALLAQRGGRRDLQARSWQALGSASGSDLLTAQGLFLELGGVGAGGPSHLGDDAQHGARRAIDELAARNPGSPELGWLALEVTSPEHGVERTQAKERLAASLAAGDPADPDVATLRIHAAFERLARGENEAALELLERLESELRNDPTVLLGLAYVARALERPDVELRALTPLAERCAEDERAADHWERVGELLESRGDGVAAEQAYASALARAAERDSAFEHLYLLVRARDDKARLVELLDARLEVVREPEGRVELLWEKARSCRTLGRRASALRALELVLELDPGHLPALSLSAEMHLGDERFEKAATSLRAIATHTETPLDIVERAGLHAADLLERLHLPREAVTLLAELEQRGVAPGGILERRARNAARAEDWELSYLTFREMSETADDDSLALEGARMMLALQRDHLHDQEALLEAARWVLTLSPLDDDAIQVLLASDDSRPEDGNLLAAAFAERLGRMRAQPQLGTPMARLAELASRAGAPAVARVALGTYSLTGVLDDRQRRSLESASPAEGAPNGRLNEEELGVLAGAAAAGPLHAPARSFSPLLARLTQPSLESLGLSSLTRIDPFAEHPLRVEVAKWATLLGLSDFDLHWGGNDPTRLLWFEAELPTVVIGEGVQLPLGVRDRARLAAGCFASARGVGAIAALPNAETELWLQALLVALGTPPALGVSPDFAPDVEERAQALGQLLSRETKDALLAEFAELTQSGHSAYDVLHGVRSASARVACLVHGDPSILRGLPRLVPEDAERRRQLLSDVVTFALSEEFESLRSKMEATS
ncbi:MAG TPA: hypothetical protein VLC09_04500, partial [Polyangiaceae bacterium]|nr:hypothetical protein [Polyangiaceae bacterium]